MALCTLGAVLGLRWLLPCHPSCCCAVHAVMLYPVGRRTLSIGLNVFPVSVSVSVHRQYCPAQPRVSAMGRYLSEFYSHYISSLPFVPGLDAAIDGAKQQESIVFVDTRPDGLPSESELTEYEACELIEIRARNILLINHTTWTESMAKIVDFGSESGAWLRSCFPL